MELLAMYSDGDRSDSPEQNSDNGEKDVSPPRVQSSFTPDLQAEWESFEKLISAGHENVKLVHQQHAPLDAVNVAEAKKDHSVNRCIDGDGAGEKPAVCVPVKIGVGSTSGTQSPWSASSNLDSDNVTEVKKQPEGEIKVPSRSPSKSPEAHSRSMSPADDKGTEKTSHRCRSRSSTPTHSSRSRSGSESSRSRSSSPERSCTRKSRSHSKSRSRSKSRSPYRTSRVSRHRRRKHTYRSKSRSRSKTQRYRRSRSPHKKSKHRRRSHSREQYRSKERRRSRSRDRFGRSTRGRDYYNKERSSPPPRRKSRSRDRSRDRESHRSSSSRDHARQHHRDSMSGRSKEKPLNFKEQMRQGLIKASKMWTESNGTFSEFIEEKKEPSTEPQNSLNTAILNNLAAVQNSTVTPQVALLQTMAAMNKKAQEMTGIAVPKYYNPAAVNPLKYAEQVQKRKLLWARTPKDKEKGPENQWEGTHFSTDQDGKMAAKFRKLMGMKPEDGYGESQQGSQGAVASSTHNSAGGSGGGGGGGGCSGSSGGSGGVASDDRKKQQEELFTRLDKEYEFARMTTHTHRGVGLGFQSQNFYQH